MTDDLVRAVSRAQLAFQVFGKQSNTDFIEFDEEMLKGWDESSAVAVRAVLDWLGDECHRIARNNDELGRHDSFQKWFERGDWVKCMGPQDE